MVNVNNTVPNVGKEQVELLRSIAGRTREDIGRIISPQHRRSPIVSRTERIRILRTSLPYAWDNYRQYRDLVTYESSLKRHKPEASLIEETGRHALRACALARAAFVLGGIEQHVTFGGANEIADKEIGKYIMSLESGQSSLPTFRLLGLTMQAAVDTYAQRPVFGRILPTMETAVGLTATAFIELYGSKVEERYFLPPAQPFKAS